MRQLKSRECLKDLNMLGNEVVQVYACRVLIEKPVGMTGSSTT